MPDISKKNTFLNSNYLKLIAIIIMVYDHLIVMFFPQETVLYFILRVPGRIAAPVICYLIAEGYHYTSNRKRYLIRLLIFSVISHFPYILCFFRDSRYGFSPIEATSVIWALAMGLTALTAIKSDKIHIVLKILILAACCAASYTANWNFVAVLWITAFGLFRNSLKRQIIAFCVIGIVFHLLPAYLRFMLSRTVYLHWYHLGIFLAVPLFALYNGKLGKKSKIISWSFYLFYPVHLIIFYLVDVFTPLKDIIEKLFSA